MIQRPARSYHRREAASESSYPGRGHSRWNNHGFRSIRPAAWRFAGTRGAAPSLFPGRVSLVPRGLWLWLRELRTCAECSGCAATAYVRPASARAERSSEIRDSRIPAIRCAGPGTDVCHCAEGWLGAFGGRCDCSESGPILCGTRRRSSIGVSRRCRPRSYHASEPGTEAPTTTSASAIAAACGFL
jgi:hypothetical protein